MDTLLGPDQWICHERESWIRLLGRFVPYPFQMNLRHLPREEMKECVLGLLRLLREQRTNKPAHFGEWISSVFGDGIARIFMRPYNFKVWAYPPEMLAYSWISDRVAVTDAERVVSNIIDERDDASWGPNNRFCFPKFGGTGSIWRECAVRLPSDKLRFNSEVRRIDTARRRVVLEDGTTNDYDRLFSTMPLDLLVELAGMDHMKPAARELLYSSTYIYGIGLCGSPCDELATKCWMYFPEDTCPFYRVTVFSNYSPFNVPDISRYWSLMAEVSESRLKPAPASAKLRVDELIRGLLNAGLIQREEDIMNIWQMKIDRGYPTPTLGRDAALNALLPSLDALGVSSRGRFGAWRYEVSNQDHSLMQGVEWADHIVMGSDEITVWHPEIVNHRK